MSEASDTQRAVWHLEEAEVALSVINRKDLSVDVCNAIKLLQSLEAKANAFDALEGLVKDSGNEIHLWKYTYFPIEPSDTGVLFNVDIWDNANDASKATFGGPDLQSAINDAVHGGGGE